MSEVMTLDKRLATWERDFNERNLFGLAFKSECQFAKQQLLKNDFSLNAARNNPSALHGAVLNVASIGISLNPALAHAYLVPRSPGSAKDNQGKWQQKPAEICLDISYRGLVKLATDAGAIKWAKADLVYEGDNFRWKGMTELPVHEFDPFDENRMDIKDPMKGLRGGYCVAQLPDGSYLVDRMTSDEIKKVSATSKAANGPWKTWPEEMAKKTLVKRASKSWPQGNERSRLDEAIGILNAHEGLEDTSASATEEQIERFMNLVAAGDGMALIAFEQEIGQDATTTCFNSGKPGEKESLKNRVRAMEREANATIAVYVEQLDEYLNSKDQGGIEQLLEEMDEAETGLVMGRLTEIQQRQLAQITEDAAA